MSLYWFISVLYITITIFLLLASSSAADEETLSSLRVHASFEFGSEKFEREMAALSVKGYEIPVLSNLLLTVFWGSKQFPNPCNLSDYVRKQLPTAVGDNVLLQPLRVVPRNVIINQVTKSVAEGCNLYRTIWVLKETKSLRIFIDRNSDHVFDGTVLRNYSHFYFWADGINRTEIFFLGMMRTDDLLKRGATLAALRFLSAMGLRNHPWKFIEFDDLPFGNLKEMMGEIRLRSASLLKEQGLFWEDEKEYIGNLMTLNFNGLESLAEIGMFGNMIKAFSEEIRKPTANADSKYNLLCEQGNQEHDRHISL